MIAELAIGLQPARGRLRFEGLLSAHASWLLALACFFVASFQMPFPPKGSEYPSALAFEGLLMPHGSWPLALVCVFSSFCFKCHPRPEGWNIQAVLRLRVCSWLRVHGSWFLRVYSKFLFQMPCPHRGLEYPCALAFEGLLMIHGSWLVALACFGSFCFKCYSRPDVWTIRALYVLRSFCCTQQFPPMGLEYPSALACFEVSVSKAIPS